MKKTIKVIRTSRDFVEVEFDFPLFYKRILSLPDGSTVARYCVMFDDLTRIEVVVQTDEEDRIVSYELTKDSASETPYESDLIHDPANGGYLSRRGEFEYVVQKATQWIEQEFMGRLKTKEA